MKYKQFIFLRNSTLIILGIGITWLIYSNLPKNTLDPTSTKYGNVENNNKANNNTNEDPFNDNNSEPGPEYRLTTGKTITAAHEEIMALQKNTPMSDGKPDPNNGGVKLFKKMMSFQIDFRSDTKKGFDYWNRVKIDWDYDKKWDEKWDFGKNGSIKRQCSSNDDGNYDIVQTTLLGEWIGDVTNASDDNSKSSTDTDAPNNQSLTALHQEIIAYQKNASLSEGKPDPNNGGVKLYKKLDAYFIDLRCDKKKGFNYFNRVKVDWDKDKKWDEKWDFRKDGSIKRQISTNDDKNYDLVLELKDGKWEGK